MIAAYVLVQTEIGQSSAVAEAVAQLPGVTLVDEVTGPYDVIVRLEAAGIDELGRLVIARLQDVPGISRTLTCTVVHG